MIRGASRGIFRPAWRWIVPLAAVAVLTAECVIVGGKRLFWTDELLTLYSVADPSFTAMLASTTEGFNSSPPLYFILGWFWAHGIGAGEVTLRLFSSLCMSAALVVFYLVLRKAYSVAAASVGIMVAFFTYLPLLYQNSEARFYGLVIAEVAAGIWLFQRLVAMRRPSRRPLVANATLHAALVMTHYFGLVYSGMILAAFVLLGLIRRRTHWSAVLSILAGWTVFLPWLPIPLRHQEHWLNPPTAADLANYYRDFWFSELGVLAVGLVALAVVGALPFRAAHRRLRRPLVRRRELPLVIVAIGLLLVPAASWAHSRYLASVPLFLDRYLLPTALGWGVLWAHATDWAVRGHRRIWTRPYATLAYRALAAAGVAAFSATLMAHTLRDAERMPTEDRPPEIDSWRCANPEAPTYDTCVRQDLPVVVELIHEFMKRNHYAARKERYLFLLDWPTALKDLRGATLNFKIMEALKRRYGIAEVVPADEFLDRTDEFLLLDSNLSNWAQLRFGGNPHYVIESLGSGVYHLTRKRP